MNFPDWMALTPEKVAADLPRLLDEAEKAVVAIEATEPQTYEEFVWKLDDATRELWRCWGSVSHMLGVMNSEAWRKLEEEWQPKIVAFSLRVSQSKKLSDIARLCLASIVDCPDPVTLSVRRRILEKMIQGAELAGVGLEGEKKARFNEIQMRLAKLGADFHNAVIDATKAFSFEKDGKTYTIDDANYPETMKHCADREVREKLYRARVTRAPENEARIDEILKLRREAAEILGFANYAEQSLATKCAPSVAAVMRMIDELDAATVGKAEEERIELCTSAGDGASPLAAASTLAGASPLEKDVCPWDVAFEAERLRERKYAYSEEGLKKCFELEDVLKGLFRMTRFLFGVEVEEMAEKPSVWHEDVRFFAVTEKGETIAHFYFDPYVRSGLKSGGAWMNEFRNRSRREVKVGGKVKVEGQGQQWMIDLPLAVVVTNFPEKDKEGKCLLPMREVETLFHEFGHALQCMLTRVDEEDAAGINLVEWDAVEVASQFMENWCLDDRTGIAVPTELKAKVRAAKNFRAATACRRQLAFAKLDVLLHGLDFKSQISDFKHQISDLKYQSPGSKVQGSGSKMASRLKCEIFTHFGIPFVPEDRFLCSFTHIFAGGYAAGYYGYKWAEVMSADCYGAFEEAGLADDEAVRQTGRRYRETVLALGGSKSALEVFRDFRGRGPEIDALLRQQDLV